jgi:hypothetical protein
MRQPVPIIVMIMMAVAIAVTDAPLVFSVNLPRSLYY